MVRPFCEGRRCENRAHYLNSMPVLGLEYGGRGAAFWAGTAQRCP